jgi:hypothetical protein
MHVCQAWAAALGCKSPEGPDGGNCYPVAWEGEGREANPYSDLLTIFFRFVPDVLAFNS